MPKVVSKSAETNARSDYFVSALAGPKVAGRRVTKGEKLNLSEHEARAELLSGALVKDEARVDDPWGEKAAAEKAAAEVRAAADAKAAEEAAEAKARAAAEAQAAADKAAEEARAAEHHDDPPAEAHPTDAHA